MYYQREGRLSSLTCSGGDVPCRHVLAHSTHLSGFTNKNVCPYQPCCMKLCRQVLNKNENLQNPKHQIKKLHLQFGIRFDIQPGVIL